MKHYLLNHQPQKGLQAACAQQGQAPTCNARGKGHTSASPKTLTRILLVLLTTFLLPSAAWGQITVGGHSLSEGNISGDNISQGTVTFKTEEETSTSILTLNNAIINGNIEYSGTYPLEIKLVGSVTMNCGSSSKAFVSTNEVSLSFSTNSTDNGSLTISDGSSYNFDASNILSFSTGFTQISCKEGSGLVSVSVDKGTIYVSKSYRISIGGISVTTDNANNVSGGNITGTGTVKYVHDATNNSGTLYLTGVTISETGTAAISIPTSLLKLTINIQGSNTIKTTDNSVVIMCNRLDGSNTVEFSGTGSLTLKRGADYGITSFLTVDENSYKDGLVPTYKEPATATSFEAANEVLISTIYNLTVAGVEVTSANCDDILKDDIYNAGKVSFKPADESTHTPARLTLNGATISNIVSNLEGNLDILISGENKLNLISSTVPVKLHITTIENLSDVTSLSLVAPNGETSSVIYGFQDFTTDLTSYSVNSEDGSPASPITVNYDTDGHALKTGDANTNAVVFSNITYYGITIGDVAVTSANLNTETSAISGLNNVFFSPAGYDGQLLVPATLTLNGATINGKIEWNSSYNLTIALNGKNTIESKKGGPLFISVTSSCALNIVKADNADATLKYVSYSESDGKIANASEYFSNFSSITPSSDFKTPFTVQVKGINYNYYTTEEVYSLAVAGRQVHNISEEPGNKDDILGDGKVKFDGSNTLTLDNAEISVTTLEGNGIETSLEALTIDLKGTNSITSSGYSFYGTGTSTINITSTSTPAGKLTLNSNTGLAKFVTVSSTVYDLQSINWNSLNALIAKGFTGLTIAGTPITSDDIGTNGVISGVSGITSGTVSFAEAKSDPETPATLTLDNASITGDIKFNASLTVHLIGVNTITKPEDADASSFYAFDLGGGYYYLRFSTDETKPGTLKFVGLDSNLPHNGIISSSTGIIEGGTYGTATDGDVIWKQEFSPDGVTPSYFILSLNKHYNLWKNGHQYYDLILANNDGFVFNPGESTLTISSSSSSDYINSGLENLTIIVSGSRSLSHIAFGAPAGTQAGDITTGTLTITGDKTNEGSNSLTLSNSDGVITGFSSVDITLPMHVSYTTPSEFTGWTSNVTYAYITDETDDYIFDEALTDGINYVTYYSLDRDLFLSKALTPSVITEISGSTVKTQALSYIPKKTPVLVNKATNTATTATFTKNMLKFAESGNPETASAEKVLYVLYNNQFVKVTPGSSVEYGSYLNLTGVNLPSSTRSLTIDGGDEGTTALREVKSEGVKGEKLADGEWYTLQGQRVTKPTKPGLYILNGKKVVIK